MPKDRDGKSIVLYLEDKCTRWTEVQEIKTLTKWAVAKFVKRDLTLRWGDPATVVIRNNFVKYADEVRAMLPNTTFVIIWEGADMTISDKHGELTALLKASDRKWSDTLDEWTDKSRNTPTIPGWKSPFQLLLGCPRRHRSRITPAETSITEIEEKTREEDQERRFAVNEGASTSATHLPDSGN